MQDVKWLKYGYTNKEPIIRIYKEYIGFSTNAVELLGDILLLDAGIKDGVIVFKPGNNYTVRKRANKTGYQARVGTPALTRQLQEEGVQLKARYKLQPKKDGHWLAYLIDIDSPPTIKKSKKIF